MKTASAKAKGRRLQQLVALNIQEFTGLTDSDIKSLPMGAPGADIWMSSAAQKEFPFAVECKNVEKINVWESFSQARRHALGTELFPLLAFSKNGEEVLVTLRLSDLLHWKAE